MLANIGTNGLPDTAMPHILSRVRERDSDQESVGKRIRAARKLKKLNQIAFAKKIGATQSMVSAWETGARALDADSLRRVANGLEVTRAHLLGEPEEKAQRSDTPRHTSDGTLLAEVKHGIPQAEARLLQQWTAERNDVLDEIVRMSTRLAELASRYRPSVDQAHRTRAGKTRRTSRA